MISKRSHLRVSLRWTLAAVISMLAVAIVISVGALLIVADNREDERDLQHKAELYAAVFAEQLRPAIDHGDKGAAREVLSASVRLDEALESAALYKEDGSLLEKVGEPAPVPWNASPVLTEVHVSDSGLEVLAPVISPGGLRGVVVLRMSRAELLRARQETIRNTGGVGAAAVLVALLLSYFIAGWVTRRLQRILRAAETVAGGDLSQPVLELGHLDEISDLAQSFNTMVSQLRQHAEERRRAAAQEQHRLEELVDARTRELEARAAELERSHERYRLLVETTSAIPWEYDRAQKQFTYVGPQAVQLLGHSLELWKNITLLRSLSPPEDVARLEHDMSLAFRTGKSLETELRFTTKDGRKLDLRCVATAALGERQLLRGLLFDMTQRKKLESELQQSQKLESVGRLAAGIAHEINTPIQFVGDSVQFVKEAFDDLLPLLEHYRRMKEGADAESFPRKLRVEVEAAEEASDINYLSKQVPLALTRCLDGLERVGRLVKSMKEYAHPEQSEKAPANLNEALATTLTIARSEYKYVAEVETSYGSIPPLLCHVNELNQAFLNIIVNSAHAISDVVQGSGKKGVIRVSTRVESGAVVVAISDTGGGIPEAVRSKIFDPFFTTKPIGKGTGQGLSIAHNMVVVKHGGSITLDSELGRGATFTIRLPIKQEPVAMTG